MTKKLYGTRSILLVAVLAMISVVLTWQGFAKGTQAPTNLVAWDSGHYVQLNWDPNGSSYDVYRSVGGPDEWAILEAKFSGTSFVDFGAPRSSLIYYRVSSVDGNAQGVPNDSVVSISTGTDFTAAWPKVRAEALSSYDKNNIITNAQLTSANSMTAAQIQSFLTAQGSVLANFSSGGKTAAQRIYDDCQTHGVNPQVVLVTLQKEKGLIKSAGGNPNYLAMGWNTGESSTWDFDNQVYYGTRQFKLYYNNLGGYGWSVGQAHSVSDGTVTASNTATAGLYIYTPWIGQGGGGQSGVGGNYLFWDLWNNTFGFESSQPAASLSFQYPLSGGWSVTQDFVWRSDWNNNNGAYHLAEDASASGSTPVYAAANGTVKFAGTGVAGYGGIIVIEHNTGTEVVTSVYGHLSASWGLQVSPNQTVSKGQLIGYVAFDNEDGGTWGPHLHFGIRKGAYSTQQICGYWPYVGYSQSCSGMTHEQYRNLWYDPTDFINGQGTNCGNGSSVSFRINGGPPVHPNGTLIKVNGGDGTIYVLRNGEKRGIPTEAILHNLYQQGNSNFDFKDVITVASDEFNSYSTGSVVNTALPGNGRTQPDGRLISNPAGEVSIVTDGGGRRPFPSAPIFTGLGYLFCNVIPVSSSEYNAYTPVGPVVDGTGDVGGGECVPTTTSINVGQTLNGSLSSSDCFVPATSRRYDVYSFTGVQGQGIAASMDSSGFDTYLYLTNSSNQILDEDNNSGPGTNSRIPNSSGFFTLPASGTYFLWASSAVDNTTGSYSISLSECSYSISSSGLTVGPGNGGGTFLMDTTSGCSWSAVSDSTSWLTTTSSGSGDGSVSFSFAANPNTSSRVGRITVGGQVHTVTQIGVGGAGNVRFSSSSYSANENGGTATITVTRSSGIGSGNVSYSTSGGTATPNTDYVPASGILIFSENVTSRTFDVTILDDSAFEGNESINLALSSPSTSLTLGSPSSATLTINDNDSSLTRTLTVASSNPTSGVNITVSPTDTNGQGNGVTQFSRTYNDGASVTLTAPSTSGINTFQKWQRDGVDWSSNTSITISVDTDRVFNAVYTTGGSTLTNFALPANGGSAVASSILNGGFAAGNVINADRRGTNWGSGGGWADANPGVFPDWVEITFNGNRSISEVDIFTLQDNYANPAEPTQAMTFTAFGVSAFDVQYWNGSNWITVPGGSITGNNKVWRQITFAPITTSRIRVLTNAAIDNGYSRITEVEAWGEATGGPTLTNFALPANGGSAVASSILNGGFAAGNVINADRRGTNWGSSGGWADANPGVFPDWVEITFNGNRSISEVDIFTLQDNYANPAEPTQAMTFTAFGVSAFDVQYWNGSNWITVPGGSITGNNKVWRQITFAPITTSRIRVLTNAAIDNGYSRITEVEAWGEATGGPTLTNFALPANGGSAVASSILNGGFAAGNVINADRRGTNWGSSGGWADANPGVFPDWVEITFNGNRSISEVDIFTLQDNYANPAEPTQAMTFTAFGVSAFDVQYWNGSNWITVPGGSITGNNKVWRQITFAPITTSRIRVLTNAAIDNGYSRITEVEAWGASGPMRP